MKGLMPYGSDMGSFIYEFFISYLRKEIVAI